MSLLEPLDGAMALLFGRDTSEDEEMTLELYREQLGCVDQVALDDALAFSLHEAAFQELLRQEQEALDSDESFYELVSMPIELEEKLAAKCSCCLEPVDDPVKRRVLPCAHMYCLACITIRCRMGLRDRALVPAQCCKREFPAEYVAEALSVDEAQVYERYLKEKAWQSLDLESAKEYACTVDSVGGVQCPGCGIGVTRIDGCGHMKCLCGCEFCITCSMEVDSCSCTEHDSGSDSDY